MSVSWGARPDTTDIAAFYFNLKSKSSCCHYNTRGLTVLVKNKEIKKLFDKAENSKQCHTYTWGSDDECSGHPGVLYYRTPDAHFLEKIVMLSYWPVKDVLTKLLSTDTKN